MLELVADACLVLGSLGASLYCHVLSRRLQRFNALETGMGGAIAVLSAQVDEMTSALSQARSAASGSADGLAALVARAEAAAARLEVQLASMHDLPEQPDEGARRLRFVRRRRTEGEEDAA